MNRTLCIRAAAVVAAVSSLSAQSLLPTYGQVVAAVGDAPTGTPAGATIGDSGPFDSAVIDGNGNVLFRARLTGPVGALDDRALYYGRTAADLQLLLRSGDPDPSGAFPGATLNSSVVSTGAPLGSGLGSSYRTNNGWLLIPAYLNGGGLIHSPFSARNDSVLFWGTPGALTVLVQKNVTTMPGGGVVDNTLANLGQRITALGSDGTAIFYATLEDLPVGTTDVTADNNSAWIVGTPGNLAYLSREGDPLLGGAVALGQLGLNIQRNDLGQVYHDESLSTTLGTTPATSANDKVLLITSTPGVHDVLMREGDQAAGLAAGVLYGSPTIGFGFGNSGRGAFSCPLTGAVTSGDDSAVFEGGIGSVLPVAREGSAAPGAGGDTFAAFAGDKVCYSDAAGTAFVATLAGPSVTTANDTGLWLGHPGAVTMLAREGDPAPGTATGVFHHFGTGVELSANELGQLTIHTNVLDGGVTMPALYTFDPLHGLQLQMIASPTGGDSFGVHPATQGAIDLVEPIPYQANGGHALGFTNTGDFVIRPSFLGSNLSAIVRGHAGSLQGTPSAVPATGGVVHTLSIDATPAHAFEIYVVLATGLGTSPGFPNPLNPALNVPLNFDPVWTQLSFDLSNSVVWGNSLFFLDGNGRATATFTMPPGFPGFAGTTLHHAAALFDFALVGTFVTEPVGCRLN